jgi:hypothetical protein
MSSSAKTVITHIKRKTRSISRSSSRHRLRRRSRSDSRSKSKFTSAPSAKKSAENAANNENLNVRDTDYYKRNFMLLEMAKKNLAEFISSQKKVVLGPKQVEELKKVTIPTIPSAPLPTKNTNREKTVDDFIELCKKIKEKPEEEVKSAETTTKQTTTYGYFSEKFLENATKKGQEMAEYGASSGEQLALTYLQLAYDYKSSSSIQFAQKVKETVTKLYPVSSGTQHRSVVDVESKDEIDDTVFVRTSINDFTLTTSAAAASSTPKPEDMVIFFFFIIFFKNLV